MQLTHEQVQAGWTAIGDKTEYEWVGGTYGLCMPSSGDCYQMPLPFGTVCLAHLDARVRTLYLGDKMNIRRSL